MALCTAGICASGYAYWSADPPIVCHWLQARNGYAASCHSLSPDSSYGFSKVKTFGSNINNEPWFHHFCPKWSFWHAKWNFSSTKSDGFGQKFRFVDLLVATLCRVTGARLTQRSCFWWPIWPNNWQVLLALLLLVATWDSFFLLPINCFVL